MGANHRKLKSILLDIGGSNFERQLTSWQIKNGTGDPTITETYAPDGAFAEAADDDYSMDLTFISDWTANGVSDFLWDHDAETVTYQLDHLYDIPGEHVRFEGEVLVKAPDVGGDQGATEQTTITLKCVLKPVKTRP